MSEQNNKIRLAYLLPNLFTAGSLFLGILSVIESTKHNFELAAAYIFLSLILDGLDGRVARMMGATSKFGAEFDSLADLVAFGVAPAMLFYYNIGFEHPKIGSLIASLFVVFGAIRLARFNVYVGILEPNVFIGLPIPTAAVAFSCWILFFNAHAEFRCYSWVLYVLSVAISILMVSHVRYPSFKTMHLSKSQYLRVFIAIIAICSMLYLWFLETLTIIVSLYIVLGLLRAAWNVTIRRKKSQIIQ